MDKFETWATIPCKIENDDKATRAVNYNLQADQIPFDRLVKNENKLIYEEQICNQDDINFDYNSIWIKMEEDITADEEQITRISFHQNTPKTLENKVGKFNNRMICVCPKCSRKGKIQSAKQRTICQDCKEPMDYECLKCGDRMFSITTVYSHILKKCRRTYQCEQCSFQGKSEHRLRCHMTTQHSGKLVCSKCSKSFETRKAVMRHKEACGINIHFLRCKFCQFDTKYKNSIRCHIRKAHKHVKSQQFVDILKNIIEEGEKIKANALNSVVGTEVNEVSSITDYKQYTQMYCTKCDEIYKNIDHDKEPDCRKCGAVTLLQCVKCLKCYPKIRLMYWHLHRTCRAQNHFKCAECNYVTTYKSCLKDHIWRKHTIIAPEDYEKCSICGKRFKFRFNRIKHERRCSEPEPCLKLRKKNDMLHVRVDDTVIPALVDDTRIKAAVNTPKLLSRKEELKVEMLTKTFCSKCNKSVKYVKHSRRMCHKCESDIMYSCDKCDKTYSHFYLIRIHVINSHLSNELEKREQCSACGKGFILYENRRKHEMRCDKQPNLQCTHCPMKTKYMQSLVRHLKRVHSKNKAVEAPKSYVCTQCGKGYYSKDNLRFHCKYYCSKEPSLACDHCRFKTYRKAQLHTHLKRSHKHLFAN